MNSRESIEQLYQTETVYSWESIGIGGKYSPFIRWAFAIFAGLLLPTFLMLVEDDPIWSLGFWYCLTLASMGILMTRYLFFPDKHFCYHLTPMGIHYTEQDMIPEVAYKIA